MLITKYDFIDEIQIATGSIIICSPSSVEIWFHSRPCFKTYYASTKYESIMNVISIDRKSSIVDWLYVISSAEDVKIGWIPVDERYKISMIIE